MTKTGTPQLFKKTKFLIVVLLEQATRAILNHHGLAPFATTRPPFIATNAIRSLM